MIPTPSHDVVGIALAEDVGAGDLTCRYFVDAARTGRSRIFSKERAIVAGIHTAAEVFRRIDASLAVEIAREDSQVVEPGQTVLTVDGSIRSTLTGERVALNFLQRLSAIATLTHRFVEAIGGCRARMLDTRKTTPGLRSLEKAAVLAGGGVNHRFGLFDMVMVKDNHLAADSGRDRLQAAIGRFRAENPALRVEFEADTLDQVREFLLMDGIDVILLDNMDCAAMSEAVRLGAGGVQFEASGGVTLDTVSAIAATGVDFISAGALTHSAGAIDYSLELVE